MPAFPRHEIVADDRVGLYHCIVRCIRRAFLCGEDPVSGKNYDHRKEWIRLRLQQLAAVFGIDICGYAVMSNHFEDKRKDTHCGGSPTRALCLLLSAASVHGAAFSAM